MILQLSNMFNLCAQWVGAKGYHFGLESDINRNVTNNANVANQVGKEYPYVLAEYPQGQIAYQARQQGQTTFTVIVNFYALQNRDNRGAVVGNTELQQLQALEILANNFWAAFRTMQKLGTPKVGFSPETISFDFIPNQHNDRLLQIQTTANLVVNAPCNTTYTDEAELQTFLNTVAVDYDFPVSDTIDYETIQPS